MPNQVTYGGTTASAPSSPAPTQNPYGTAPAGQYSLIPGSPSAINALPGGAALNQVNQTLGQANLGSQLFNLFQTSDAPANQQINNQVGYLQNQADILGAGYQTQAGYLGQSLQNQLAGIGLQQQSQAIQGGALGRQSSLLPQQHDIQTQQYGIQGQQLGIAGQQQDIQGKQLGIQDAAIQQQMQDLFYGNNRAQQNLVAQKAAAGASNTPGAALGQQDLAQQLQSSLAGIDRSQQQQGLAKQQLGLQRQGLGLQQQGLGLQQKSSDLSFNEQLAQNTDAQKQLDVMGQKTGLDKSEIQNRTQQALDQLGLSTSLSTIDVYKAMADAQKGLYNPVSQVLGYVYQLSGLNPFAG